MNRRMLTLCLAVGALALVSIPMGCASPRPPGKHVPVVHVAQMHEVLPDPTRTRDLRPTIVHAPAGTHVPIQVMARTPFAHTEQGTDPSRLVFDRDVFIYLSPQGMLLSYDRRQWFDPGDRFDSTLSFGLASSAQQPGQASAHVSLALRDEGSPRARPAQPSP